MQYRYFVLLYVTYAHVCQIVILLSYVDSVHFKHMSRLHFLCE